MKKRSAIFFFMIFSLVITKGMAQYGYNYDYTTEFIWRINKNTSSGLIVGCIFKHSKAIKTCVYRTLGMEMVNIKHPSDVRLNSIITGSFFILT